MEMNFYNLSIYLNEEYEELARIRVAKLNEFSFGLYTIEDYLRSLLLEGLVKDKMLYDECKAAGLEKRA